MNLALIVTANEFVDCIQRLKTQYLSTIATKYNFEHFLSRCKSNIDSMNRVVFRAPESSKKTQELGTRRRGRVIDFLVVVILFAVI